MINQIKLMKKIKKIRIISFSVLLLFAACSIGEDPIDPASFPKYVTAKVDGVQFVSEREGEASVTGSGKTYAIRLVSYKFFTDGTYDSMRLDLTNINTTGTYSIGQQGSFINLTYSEKRSSVNEWVSNSGCGNSTVDKGTVIVTSISDKGIEGTFSFTLRASTGSSPVRCSAKQITEGRFRGTF